MKKIICILTLGFIVTACSNELDSPQTMEKGVMTFEMNHPATTKVTSDKFESGDKIGIFATSYTTSTPTPLQLSGNWANNVATILNDNTWKPASTIYWSTSGKMDVYAYYPYMNITSVDEQPFSVALDQNTIKSGSTLGGYEASDFLWAKSTLNVATDINKTVALTYSHRLSKLVIKLVKGADYEGEFPNDSELYLYNVVPTATIDLATGAVTKDLFGEAGTIKARRVDNETFEAIIVPQRVESRRPLVEYIANGVSYLLEDSFNFKAGKKHTLSLTINSNPDQAAIEIGGATVEGWN